VEIASELMMKLIDLTLFHPDVSQPGDNNGANVNVQLYERSLSGEESLEKKTE